jgi:hypothetical protein
LRIGKVIGDLTAPRVALRAKLDTLEFVSVLFHEDPSRALMGEFLPGEQRRTTASRRDIQLEIEPLPVRP